jgi:hypothetical protein
MKKRIPVPQKSPKVEKSKKAYDREAHKRAVEEKLEEMRKERIEETARTFRGKYKVGDILRCKESGVYYTITHITEK